MAAIKQALVLNAGSSSLKFSLMSAHTLLPLINGVVEHIGEPGPGSIKLREHGDSRVHQPPQPTADHHSAMQLVLEHLHKHLDGVGALGGTGQGRADSAHLRPSRPAHSVCSCRSRWPSHCAWLDHVGAKATDARCQGALCALRILQAAALQVISVLGVAQNACITAHPLG
jgi:hypothetical protein